MKSKVGGGDVGGGMLGGDVGEDVGGGCWGDVVLSSIATPD
jgi:hypothetical protein